MICSFINVVQWKMLDRMRKKELAAIQAQEFYSSLTCSGRNIKASSAFPAQLAG